MVRNEQDIIEPFIRHNIRFFDLMFVLDNGSTDKTRQILVDCAREFGSLCVSDIPNAEYDQGRFMTEAMRYVQAACFADFVAFLDADEFIEAEDRQSFDAAVSTIPKGFFGKMKWKTLLPDPSISEQQNPDCLDRMTWQRRVESPQYVKGIYRAGGSLCLDCVVDQGNHAFRFLNGKLRRSIDLNKLSLLHLPIRSSNQTLAKGVNGWRANLARSEVPGDAAFQWKRLHDLYEEGRKTLDSAELAHEAMLYAQTRAPEAWKENAVEFEHQIVRKRSFSDGLSASIETLLKPERPAPPSAAYIPAKSNSESRSTAKIEHAFDDKWHWDHFFLDIPPIQFGLDKFEPNSCLDVGCGTGALLDFLTRSGVDTILGVDGIRPEATMLDPKDYVQGDLEQPLELNRHFDLVVCLEVVEHVDPTNTGTIFESISRHAKNRILFSMAEPGQPGNQHINCLSMEEVLNKWAQFGWYPVLEDTLALRAVSSLSWFRRNLLLLERTRKSNHQETGEVLRRIGARKHDWYSQNGGIRRFPFNETEMPEGKGYV
ncbi:hypothetical protein ACMU_00995 [Actibacterium mucosum KCTC 23349]|uniref:Uncharacterized protein n=1 Tax=Actibacterium mucosum KCTC 23349 TaxID=1454373 RepID=A0A037ZNI0_9RHOB|nr:glycosyltransferase family 2 protein [Actibacterium mucosum]KAJ57098.1 hypothetical protein ACMU_00995 [Actibacterium mucosum KCTC 23349]